MALEDDGVREELRSQGLSDSGDLSVRRRARMGMLILGGRSGLQHVFVLGGTVVLARLLSPADFGTFAIVHFVLSLFRTLGDVGLGPSLVQKTSAPTDRELSSLFWGQLALTGCVVAMIFAGASFVTQNWTDLPPEGPNLLRALSISLLFNMLRTVPSIMLERELRFLPISAIEFLGTIAYYGTAVALAWMGWGAQALVGAVLIQAFTTLVAIYAVKPWWPRFQFDIQAIRQMLRFGLPYQGKVVGGLVNNAVTPVLAGTLLGSTALGLNNFAHTTAWFPLHLVTIIGRVSFPLFSRLSNNRVALAEELRFSLRLCGTTAIGFTVLFLAIGPQLVAIVYHPKWIPAMPSLYIYSGALIFGFATPIAGAVFDGLGRPQVMFRLALIWTVINWATVGAVLTFRQDQVAFALAFSVHVVAGAILAIYFLRKEVVRVSLIRLLGPSLVVGAAVAGLGRRVLAPHIDGPFSLLGSAIAVIGCYVLISVLIDSDLRRACIAWGRSHRLKGPNT